MREAARAGGALFVPERLRGGPQNRRGGAEVLAREQQARRYCSHHQEVHSWESCL